MYISLIKNKNTFINNLFATQAQFEILIVFIGIPKYFKTKHILFCDNKANKNNELF
tara:strand:+ start:612 stop:779 length:168 start_codon:yes stop_codon:yes gene_type:complete